MDSRQTPLSIESRPLSGAIAAAYRLGQAVLRDSLYEYGIKAGQADMLWIICNNEGMTQAQLAETLYITPAAVAQSIASLEKTGFVRREVDERDHRSRRVFATEEAKKLKPVLDESFERVISLHQDVLTPEELSCTSRSLAKIVGSLADAL